MANVLKQIFSFFFDSDRQWWLEIKTTAPACTYYFGPFDTEPDAQAQQQGYLDDLQQEGAKVIAAAAIALDSPPPQLTIYEEGIDDQAPDPAPAFSGQS
ncbi:MAG: DUF1816 domain-containing protein [Cyanobacteria bacterium P01_C01_bin.120]